MPVNGILRELCPSSGAARHLPPQGKAFINLPEALIPAQQAQEAEAAAAEPAADESASPAAEETAPAENEDPEKAVER